MKAWAKELLSLGLLLLAAAGAYSSEIKSGFLADFRVVTEGDGSWADGSETGTWTVGFGDRLGPKANFNPAPFDPRIGGKHGAYGFSTRQFVNDPERTILPGSGAYSGSAVIRWTAARKCRISVFGKLARVQEPGGNDDGVDLYLYQDTKRLLLIKDVMDVIPRDINAKEIALNPGEALYFVVSPKENNINDAVYFTEDLVIVGTTED